MGRVSLEDDCRRLRSLHVPGAPLVLPNAWDAASARAVVAAGFPVVATTSAGVAAALGYEDHESAPPDGMLAAAARIAGAVDVPVTVDAEAGYGMAPADLVSALERAGAAGCNLEDTDHEADRLREAARQAEWLAAVREAADERGCRLVINARIDVFVFAAGHGGAEQPQAELVDDALERARAYAEAGVDCVYPIALWQAEALSAFTSEAPVAVNALRIPPAPPLAELAEMGVARVSYGGLLHHQTMERFATELESVERPPDD